MKGCSWGLGIKMGCLLVPALFILCKSNSQNVVWQIPLRLDAGVMFTGIEESGTDLSQNPATAVMLQAGVGARIKDRIGLNLQGGWFIERYSYNLNEGDYALGHLAPRINGTVYFLSNEINPHGSRFHFGFGGGYSFWTDDAERSVETAFSVDSRIRDEGAWFLSPQIGLTQIYAKSSMDITLAYVQHINGADGVQIDFTTQNGSAIATGRGNYLALRVGYSFDLNPTPERPVPYPLQPSVSREFRSRRVEEMDVFETKSNRVKMVIYDNAEIDGDTLSIALNEKFVVTKYALKRKKKVIRLPLSEGMNNITIYAHNEGDTPPNTAKVILKSGLNRKEILVNTSLRKNQRLKIVKKVN